MAKQAFLQRELKREKLAAKFANKVQRAQTIASDAKRSDEERRRSPGFCRSCPQQQPDRQRNRCEITGRPRGTFRQFGLARAKVRELAFAGEIPA